jgi:monovalent cation:proton antiporter-2 (CPA2) family protein
MTDGFLYYALIFLLAAVIVVPIAKRTGLGAILGYLLAGVAIGPYVLGLINEPEDIMHFAEFGVVLMLFLIGLELQPSTLWRLRKSIIGLGASQVIFSTLAIAAVAGLFGLSWPVCLAIGMGLSLSSTAIIIQLLNERNLMPTYPGQSAFSILLFQDIAVIPILASLPILATSAGVVSQDAVIEKDMGYWWEETFKVVGFVGTLIVLGHYGLRHVLRYIAQTRVPEIFTATALLLVIGVAFLMQAIGLSPALGAFIAGVILADSEYRHEIEVQIKPFKSLLLGLFFISVGMSVNFDVLGNHLNAVVLSVIALMSLKFLIMAGISKIFGMQAYQYVLLSTLLAQGGEFAFVISQYAHQVNLFDTELSNIINVTVALSMLLTPLSMILYDRIAQKKFSSFSSVDAPKTSQDLSVEQNSVIVIGFGRFGQIIGRLLRVNGIPTTVLDHDPENIEFLRKSGWKVFYCDATDMEALKSAGAGRARLLVLAIDNHDVGLKVARRIRETFPDLRLYVRAHDRRHAYELSKIGVEYFERETFESAIHMGQEVLKAIGYRPESARTLSQKFAQHDRKTLRDSFAHFEDEKALITFAQSARTELESLFESDRTNPDLHKNGSGNHLDAQPAPEQSTVTAKADASL